MIKIFRKIREKLIKEGKIKKYLLYAIGEIVLVVIGILIALQLNTQKENNEKKELGYKYLTEMRAELQSDLFALGRRIRVLNKNIKNHEAALQTKNIATLPLDSIGMIIHPQNLDFKISELTFNKMKNLGLTSLTENDLLNSKITIYYSTTVVDVKLSMDFVFEELKKYLNFLTYQQDAIDEIFFQQDFQEFEFPALYKKSYEEFKIETKINSVAFITSNKGRLLVQDDLSNKRYSQRVLNRFKNTTQDLLETIYAELKSNNPETLPLPEFPSDADFKEITLTPEILKKYKGIYKTETNKMYKVLLEEDRLYIEYEDGFRIALTPSANDRFFDDVYDAVIQFNSKNGNILGFKVMAEAKEYNLIKVDEKIK